MAGEVEHLTTEAQRGEAATRDFEQEQTETKKSLLKMRNS